MPGAESIDPNQAAQAMNLFQAGYAKRAIARIVGIDDSSVFGIINEHGRWGEIAEKPVFQKLRAEQNQHLEASFRAAAAHSLGLAMTPEKLAKASYYQLMLGSTIAIDKARLLGGESTENISVQSHIEVTGLDQLAEALSRKLITSSTQSNTDIPQSNQASADLIIEGGAKPIIVADGVVGK